MKLLLIIIFSYLCGAIPFGFIITKLFTGLNIRNYGSANPGATNVFRVAGPIAGVITLLLDSAKGFLPVFIVASIWGNQSTAVIAGLCAIIGHMWTVFLGFKGGKGVATAAGVFLALIPLSVLFTLGVFIAVFTIFGYISLASIFAAFCLPIFVLITKSSKLIFIFSLLISITVLIKHIPNIKRLLAGKENKLKIFKKEKL